MPRASFAPPVPDLVTFWLADRIDERGWGLAGDTFHVDNHTDYAIDIYVDGHYKGTVSGMGDMYINDRTGGDYTAETTAGAAEVIAAGGRFIAIPFIVEMIVAILSTKIALYLGTSPLPLPPAPPKIGFWAVMHETRSDYAQLLTVAFLMLAGPGRWCAGSARRWRGPAGAAPHPGWAPRCRGRRFRAHR